MLPALSEVTTRRYAAFFDWKLSKAVQLQRPRPYDKPATTETRQLHDYAASNTTDKTDTASRAAGL